MMPCYCLGSGRRLDAVLSVRADGMRSQRKSYHIRDASCTFQTSFAEPFTPSAPSQANAALMNVGPRTVGLGDAVKAQPRCLRAFVADLARRNEASLAAHRAALPPTGPGATLLPTRHDRWAAL